MQFWTKATIKAMRIALVVTPPNEPNLCLAAQIGVDDIVGRYTGRSLQDLLKLRDRVSAVGLRLSVIEGYVPHDQIVSGGAQRDQQIADFQQLIRNMGEVGVPICCYNFMPDEEWSRSSISTPERGGAFVTAFDADLASNTRRGPAAPIDSEQMWVNLEYFLQAIVPVAEASNVKLAMHPDDPPMPFLYGQHRIMSRLSDFERLVQLVPSPVNGVCFCQGCFAEMGEDVPAAIRKLGPHIRYVHFRDVCGCVPRFRESFHDNGQTNMAEAMRAYFDIDFDGPMRPDHVPELVGEHTGDIVGPKIPSDQITVDTFNGTDIPVPPGYTMMGRLFAVGYMRGLMHGAEESLSHARTPSGGSELAITKLVVGSERESSSAT